MSEARRKSLLKMSGKKREARYEFFKGIVIW